MATVSKEIADKIVSGAYPEDNATRIVKYTNAWGGESYGVTFRSEPKEKYLEETGIVINPSVYWDPELGIDNACQ